MLHLRYKAETGNEATGSYYKNITFRPGIVEGVLVNSGSREEYVEWLEKLIETFEEKMRHPVYEIGGTLSDLKISKEQIEEFNKNKILGSIEHPSVFSNVPESIDCKGINIEGQIIKSHTEGEVTVIDEFKITGVSVDCNDDMVGYVKQD